MKPGQWGPRTSEGRTAGAHLGLVAVLELLAAGLALSGQFGAGAPESLLTWVRIPLGLLALLVLPGYALAVALFPRAHDLDGLERTALAVGLSVAQVPLLVLAVDRSPWGLSPTIMVVSVGALTCLWCVVAVVRLWRQPAGAGFRPAVWLVQRSRSPVTRLERVAVLGSVVLVGAVACSLLTVSAQPALPPLTEFFMLGSEGLAENYPRSVAAGEPVSVTLGVTNREGRPMEYRVVAHQRDVSLAETSPFRVEPGATWTGRLDFVLREYGFDQRVEAVLFRTSDAAPYRRLQLVVDAPQPGAPTPVRVPQAPGTRG